MIQMHELKPDADFDLYLTEKAKKGVLGGKEK